MTEETGRAPVVAMVVERHTQREKGGGGRNLSGKAREIERRQVERPRDLKTNSDG